MIQDGQERQLSPLRYIETHEQLVAWVNRLAQSDAPIAVDTESDSFHRYREKVCLVQMTALGEDVIIDALALSDMQPLRAVLADKNRIKIFHDACYDLICLQRDFGFVVRGLFDTMLASRLLGAKRFGLAAILWERFGFVADKRFQRSDWGQRPLSLEQLNYARFDTHYLPALADALKAELIAHDRLRWAEEEFVRLPVTIGRIPQKVVGIDANAFWRLTGVRDLSAVAKGRLKALVMCREHIAQRIDRPPFKVVGDAVLLALAKEPPTSFLAWAPGPGLRRGGIARHGRELFFAMDKAEPVTGGPPRLGVRRRRSGRDLDPPTRERYEALRALRKERADAMGLDPEVALSNAAVEDLARKPPKSIEDIKAREDFVGWRGSQLATALFLGLCRHEAQRAALAVAEAQAQGLEAPVKDVV